MHPSRASFALGLWLAVVLPLHAQQGGPQDSSHLRLPGTIDREAAEKRLAERFQISAEKSPLGLLEMLVKNPERYGIDPKKFEEIAREVAKRPQDFGLNPNDPKLQEMARKLAAEAKFTPEQIETFNRLKDIIPGFKPPDLKPPDIKPPDRDKPADKDKPSDKDKPADGGKPSDKAADKDKPGGTNTLPPSSPGTQPPSSGVIKPSQPRKANKGWLSEQLSKLRSEGGLSGEVRERIRDFLGAETKFGEFSRGLSRETRRLSSKILPDLQGIRLDRLVRDILPRDMNISPPRFDVSLGSPSVGAPSLPSGDGLGSVLLVLVVLALAAAGIYMLARSRGWVGEPGDGWKLGPWPVSPAAVRTRDDLIKAFEHLALLLLGRQAGASNHLAIAGQLANREQSGRGSEAAVELAELYEHARYAPPGEPLSETEMEMARRDLCYLAGVSAA